MNSYVPDSMDWANPMAASTQQNPSLNGVVMNNSTATAGTTTGTEVPSAGTAVVSGLDQSTAYQTLRPLIQALPLELSCVLWEAVMTAPQLVAAESDPRKFLECEQRDLSKAALRLCMYWKNRKEVFGDRTFLPMNQTGLGTLDDSDIELLHTGAVVPIANDNLGRPVLACDISRYHPEHSYPWYRAARLRLAYYMASVACENPKAQSEGLILLVLITSTALNEATTKSMMRGFDFLPIKNVKMHLICLPSKTVGMSFVDKMTHFTLHAIGHYANWAIVHRGRTDDLVLEGLIQAVGITRDDLPAWFGGSWVFDNFERWRIRRLRTEENRFMNDSEKEERRRKLVATRSQVKRDRKNQQMHDVQEEIADLETRNAGLCESNEALACALEHAQDEVDLYSNVQASSQKPPEILSSNDLSNIWNVPVFEEPGKMNFAPAIFSPPGSLFTTAKSQRMAPNFFAQMDPAAATRLQQISIGSFVMDHDDVAHDDGDKKPSAVPTSFG
jgi:hypothetical protein